MRPYNTGTKCGTLVPRMSHSGFDAEDARFDSAECASALGSTQSACSAAETSSIHDDAFCAGLLDAAPSSLTEAVTSHVVQGRHVFIYWSEHRVAGVVPSVTCSIRRGSVDLSDNLLVGSIPSCLTDGSTPGVGSIRLARNRLSGGIPALGRHLHHVTLHGNHLTGDLAAAAASASGVKHLDVSSNDLHGDLASVITAMPQIESLDIEGNPNVRGLRSSIDLISSHASLGHYAIGGIDGGAPPLGLQSPRAHVGVHVSLVLTGRAESFCPRCAESVTSGTCANTQECRGGEGQDHVATGGGLADMLECSVASAAAAALGADCSHVKASLVRLLPHRMELADEAVTVVALDVSIPPGHLARDAARNIPRALASAVGADFKAASWVDKACGHTARLASMGAVRFAEARPACPTGASGASCQHFCAATWRRTSPLHDDFLSLHSPRSRGDAGALDTTSLVSEERELHPSAGGAALPALGTGLQTHAAAEGQSDQIAPSSSRGSRQTAAARRGAHHMYVGPLAHDDERLFAGFHKVEQCAVQCRGRAAHAIQACHEWVHHIEGVASGVTVKAKLFACKTTMSEMLSECGQTHTACTARAAGAAPAHHGEGCQVCGIHAKFARHGLYGAASHFVAGSVRPADGSDAADAAAAAAAESDRVYREQARNAFSDPNPLKAEMRDGISKLGIHQLLVENGMSSAQAERHIAAHQPDDGMVRSALLGAPLATAASPPRRPISSSSVSFNDAMASAIDGSNSGGGNDGDSASAALARLSAAQYPRCEAPVTLCSIECSTSINKALAVCDAWSRDQDVAGGKGTCGAAEANTRAVCKGADSTSADAGCHDAALTSYVELLNGGGVSSTSQAKASKRTSSRPTSRSATSGGSHDRAKIGLLKKAFGACDIVATQSSLANLDKKSVACASGQVLAGFSYVGDAVCGADSGKFAVETSCVVGGEEGTPDIDTGSCSVHYTENFLFTNAADVIGITKSTEWSSAGNNALVTCPTGQALSRFEYTKVDSTTGRIEYTCCAYTGMQAVSRCETRAGQYKYVGALKGMASLSLIDAKCVSDDSHYVLTGRQMYTGTDLKGDHFRVDYTCCERIYAPTARLPAKDVTPTLAPYCSPRGLTTTMIKDYCEGDRPDAVNSWNGVVTCRVPGMTGALDFYSSATAALTCGGDGAGESTAYTLRISAAVTADHLDSRTRGGVARGIVGTPEGVNSGSSFANLDDLFLEGAQCGGNGFMQGWSISPSLKRAGTAALTRTINTVEEKRMMLNDRKTKMVVDSDIVPNYKPSRYMRMTTSCVDAQYRVTPGSCFTTKSKPFDYFQSTRGAKSVHNGFEMLCSEGQALQVWKMKWGTSSAGYVEMECCEGAACEDTEYVVRTESRQQSSADMAAYSPIACREGDLLVGWRSVRNVSFVDAYAATGTHFEAVCRKPANIAADDQPMFIDSPDMTMTPRYSKVRPRIIPYASVTMSFYLDAIRPGHFTKCPQWISGLARRCKLQS